MAGSDEILITEAERDFSLLGKKKGAGDSFFLARTLGKEVKLQKR